MPTFFDLDFWRQFVTTTAGVGLGIPVALWIERCIENQKMKEERNALVQALRGALTKNLDLIEHLSVNLPKGPAFTPLYPMDLTVLDSTSSKKYELMHGGETASAIDHARFKLICLDKKLSLLRERLARLGESRAADSFLSEIKQAIERDLPDARNRLESALKILKSDSKA